MSNFKLTVNVDDPDRVRSDATYLRDLCRKEASRFDEYLRTTDPQFRDGLARFELLAVEGYLYQKAKGHIDEEDGNRVDTVEGQDGAS
jgi:hypothetical protein